MSLISLFQFDWNCVFFYYARDDVQSRKEKWRKRMIQENKKKTWQKTRNVFGKIIWYNEFSLCCLFALEINPRRIYLRREGGKERRRKKKSCLLSRHHGFRQHLNPKRTMRPAQQCLRLCSPLVLYSAPRHWGLILSLSLVFFSTLFSVVCLFPNVDAVVSL